MKTLSLDLRRRIVEAYRAKKSGTYEQTAEVFGIGDATVSRLLRRYRETGDVLPKKKGGNNPRRVDLEWLRAQLEAKPDDRLIDRVEAWATHTGKRVSIMAIWSGVRALGWTHKKRRSTHANKIARRSKSDG